jgi:hypothetical protein
MLPGSVNRAKQAGGMRHVAAQGRDQRQATQWAGREPGNMVYSQYEPFTGERFRPIHLFGIDQPSRIIAEHDQDHGIALCGAGLIQSVFVTRQPKPGIALQNAATPRCAQTCAIWLRTVEEVAAVRS